MKYKLLLVLVLFFSCSYFSSAQTSIESLSKGIEYTNDNEIMRNFKTAANDLVKGGAELTPEKAGQQLKRTEGKRIRIDAAPPNKTPLSGGKVYERALNSVVLIGKPYSRGDHNYYASATGYIIDSSGIVVTNYHVIETYANGIRGAFAVLVHTNDNKTYPVKKVLSASKEQDLVVLQLETNGGKLNPIALGQPAAVGNTVYVLGHLQQMINFFTKGIVSRNVKQENHRGNILEYEMSITADYGLGSSGGPVLDKYGNVAGTVSSTYNVYTGNRKNRELQVVVKSAIPVAALKQLVNY